MVVSAKALYSDSSPSRSFGLGLDEQERATKYTKYFDREVTASSLNEQFDHGVPLITL
jgi:hypothetical protein